MFFDTGSVYLLTEVRAVSYKGKVPVHELTPLFDAIIVLALIEDIQDF